MAETPDLEQMYRDLDEADRAGESDLAGRIMMKIRATQNQEIPTPSVPKQIAEWAGPKAAAFSAGRVGGLIQPLVDLPVAAAGTALSYLTPQRGTLGERWNREYGGLQRTREELRQESPIAYGAGELTQPIRNPMMKLLPTPASSAVTAAGPATRAGAAMLDSATLGATSSLLRGDQPRDAVQAFMSPWNAMAAVPAASGQVRGAIRERAATKVKDYVDTNTTPEARQLLGEGVNLSVGQRVGINNPLGIAEATGQGSALGGNAPAREAGKGSWIVGRFRAALAPKDTKPIPNEPMGAAKEVHDRLTSEYNALGKSPVKPEVLDELPQRAMELPDRIPDDVRKAAAKEIENALSIIPKVEKPQLFGPGGEQLPGGGYAPSTVNDLIAVRTEIRNRMRSERAAGPERAHMVRTLEVAEDAVTDAIARSLTPIKRNRLAALDQRYAYYMAAENSAPRGKVEFTPDQYARELEYQLGRRKFKHGEGGPTQQSVLAAREVFKDVPRTGFTPSLIANIPGMTRWGGPASIAVQDLYNTTPGLKLQKPAITDTDPVRRMAMVADFLRRKNAQGE